MSKSIQNKGWNGMKSLLDDTMPTQRTHRGKWLLLGLLFIAISWILGYHFGKNSDNLKVETPVAAIMNKSEVQQSNSDNQPGKTNSISETPNIQPKTELLSVQEELTIPAKRTRTLVEISPVRQVELNSDPAANTDQSLIQSYIEEAMLSGREEILFENTSPPIEDNASIFSEESNSSKNTESKNILSQENIIVIDEAVDESETKSESESVAEETAKPDIQPEMPKHRKHVFCLNAAATTQTYAIRHVGIQTGLEYDYRFSPKWSAFINTGMELRNIYNTNQQALIHENRQNSNYFETGFSLNAKHNVAEVNYDYMISAHVGTGVRYSLSPKWIIYTGFTVHPLISLVKRSVSHLPTYADGSPNIEILYAEEIDSNYNINNSYELSSTLGVTYFPRRKFGITMFYQHGFRGLLKYDLQNFDLSRRGIGLGIQYVL